MKETRQYGTWSSLISPQMLASSLRLNDVQWDTEEGTLVWSEGRGGRGVLVAQSGFDAPRDLTEEDMAVRARVGYGGGDFTVAEGRVYFAGPEGRLYRQSLAGGTPRPITPAFGNVASPRVSPDGEWVVYVHSYENQDSLGLVDCKGKMWPRKLASGSDFVMQPAWHPSGAYLAYVTWDHPNMPWNGTELRLARLATDHSGMPYVEAVGVIAGDTNTSIFQPEFSPDGSYLTYISNQTGFGQLYIYDLDAHTHRQLTDDEADHGKPAWIQGMRTYGWTADSQGIYFLRNDGGFYNLHYYNIQSGKETPVLGLEHYTDLSQVAVAPGDSAVALIASSSQIPERIITYKPHSDVVPPRIWSAAPSIDVIVEEDDRPPGERVHRRSATENITPEKLAAAQQVAWPGHDGDVVYGLYYPPTSDRFEDTGTPPLIVMIHGGPTSQSVADFRGEVQFFATRGYAVLQVNYRGSTGYGKAYMDKLRGNWGLYDVEDAASGAEYLASQGMVDAERLVIMGGSAGGYTVLQSLVDKPGFYRAGVCRYGISNQFQLVQDTHKFEARYSDSLLGSLPEAADLYRERSPLFHAERIVDPVIIFQGEDDRVVPKNQSDSLVEVLRARGVPHEYHVYEGEGHGWRKPETIEAYYKSVLQFLNQHVIYA